MRVTIDTEIDLTVDQFTGKEIYDLFLVDLPTYTSWFELANCERNRLEAEAEKRGDDALFIALPTMFQRLCEEGKIGDKQFIAYAFEGFTSMIKREFIVQRARAQTENKLLALVKKVLDVKDDDPRWIMLTSMIELSQKQQPRQGLTGADAKRHVAAKGA